MLSVSFSASLLNSAKGLFWLVFLLWLSQKLPMSQLGLTLLIFALIPFFAGILTSGWAEWLRNSQIDSAQIPHQAVESLTLRFAWMSTALLFALPFGLLPTGFSIGTLGLFLGCTGLIAMLDLRCSVLFPSRGIMIQTCTIFLALGMSSGLIMVASKYWSLSTNSSIGFYLLSLLIVVPVQVSRCIRRNDERSVRSIPHKAIARTGVILFNNLDLLVAVYCLTSQGAAVYALARLLVGGMTHAFFILENRLWPPLSYAAGNRQKGEFVALSARANLGFMLIGGAVALSLIVFGPKLLQAIDPAFQQSSRALLWLTLASCTPAVFGATNMMMSVTALESQRTAILWISMPFALVLMAFMATEGPEKLAMGVALSQLTMSCICAVILGKMRGVWPGFTALMHQGLRLR